MKHFSHHIAHYLSLFGVLFAAFIAFLMFPHDKYFQTAILVSVAAAYVTWGIVHHYLHRDLHLAVIIEYIAVAILGLVVVFSLITRS